MVFWALEEHPALRCVCMCGWTRWETRLFTTHSPLPRGPSEAPHLKRALETPLYWQTTGKKESDSPKWGLFVQFYLKKECDWDHLLLGLDRQILSRPPRTLSLFITGSFRSRITWPRAKEMGRVGTACGSYNLLVPICLFLYPSVGQTWCPTFCCS